MNSELILSILNKYNGVCDPHKRDAKTVLLRAALAYELRQLDLPFKIIGDVLCRDHTTIMYLLNRLNSRETNTYAELHKLVDAINLYPDVITALNDDVFFKKIPPLYRQILKGSPRTKKKIQIYAAQQDILAEKIQRKYRLFLQNRTNKKRVQLIEALIIYEGWQYGLPIITISRLIARYKPAVSRIIGKFESNDFGKYSVVPSLFEKFKKVEEVHPLMLACPAQRRTAYV